MAKASTKPYITVYPIKHNGERYNAGDTVEMSPRDADVLVKRGSLIEETPKSFASTNGGDNA